MSTTDIIVETKAKAPMAVENGNYTLETVTDQMTYAQWLIDKKLVSDTFKNASQLVIAVQLCKDLNLPNSALSCFYVVGGKPAIYGDVLIGLVMGSGLISGKTVKFFDDAGEYIKVPKKGQKPFGCEVSYWRQDWKEPIVAHYTLDDKADSKTTNPTWYKFEKDMLWRRADVRAIKMTAPDAMKGIEVVDYLEDAEGIKTLKSETADKARLLTEKFSEKYVEPEPGSSMK